MRSLLLTLVMLLLISPALAQQTQQKKVNPATAPVLISLQSMSAARQKELDSYAQRTGELKKMTPSSNRDALMRQEILRHQAELKRLSMDKASYRKKVVSELSRDWKKVEADWDVEYKRHDKSLKEIEKMPAGQPKEAAIKAERESHRSNSKKIAVARHKVHEGVIRQANIDALGGVSETSASVKQTAGTRIGDPNHQGMRSDWDGGGGYRTTEKASKILNEMGVKGPGGGRVKISGGVMETAGDFGMTINASPGADRIGSAGHQTQVKVAGTHHETYVSEMGGAVRSKPLKDQLAVLDHAKKALPGLSATPESLVGSSEGRSMAKGALKAATQSGLPAETVNKIAGKHGLTDPDGMLEKLADIKSGRVSIQDAKEAAKLQGASRDLIEASKATTSARASSQIKQMEANVSQLEAAGKRVEARQARSELSDFREKFRAASEAVGDTAQGKLATKQSGFKETEPQAKGGSRAMTAAGLFLGAYGIYEGYKKAQEEMEAKKEAEPKALSGWSAQKAELAARTVWHGLGFGAAAEMGAKAGSEAYDEYEKGIISGKTPDTWTSVMIMKTKAVVGGMYGFTKAITYDAAKHSITSLDSALTELRGIEKDRLNLIKTELNEKIGNTERSRLIYEKLVQKGASSVGAQRAADAAHSGDLSEAIRLNKILDAKHKLSQGKAEESTDEQKIASTKRANDKNQAEKTKEKDYSSEQEKLRQIVIEKLTARNLRAIDSLVDRLVGILGKDGNNALEQALAEVCTMQGTFVGKLDGRARLQITVSGEKVAGSFLHVMNSPIGNKVISTRTSAQLEGDIDPASGSISMILRGRVTNPGFGSRLKPMNIEIPATRLTGRFNGRGYSGRYGDSGSWSVSR